VFAEFRARIAANPIRRKFTCAFIARGESAQREVEVTHNPVFRELPISAEWRPCPRSRLSGDKKSASQSGSWALSCLPRSGSMIPPGPLQWWPQEIQMEKDNAIDSQIKRLEDYLLGNKQIVNAHEITIEQALALAYIARELRDRKA
jgi:hypothetical protein